MALAGGRPCKHCSCFHVGSARQMTWARRQRIWNSQSEEGIQNSLTLRHRRALQTVTVEQIASFVRICTLQSAPRAWWNCFVFWSSWFFRAFWFISPVLWYITDYRHTTSSMVNHHTAFSNNFGSQNCSIEFSTLYFDPLHKKSSLVTLDDLVSDSSGLYSKLPLASSYRWIINNNRLIA